MVDAADASICGPCGERSPGTEQTTARKPEQAPRKPAIKPDPRLFEYLESTKRPQIKQGDGGR